MPVPPSPNGRPARIVTEVRLPCAAADAFALASDPAALGALTPGWLSVRLLGPRPPRLAVGALLDYELRLRGVPFRWRTEITAWEPPGGFSERQARGPFRSWAMRHEIVPDGRGVLLRETMEYRPPGGAVVDWLLRPELERIVSCRGRRLLERAVARG